MTAARNRRRAPRRDIGRKFEPRGRIVCHSGPVSASGAEVGTTLAMATGIGDGILVDWRLWRATRPIRTPRERDDHIGVILNASRP